MCLVGIRVNDTEQDVAWACSKITGAKLWPDVQGRLWQQGVAHMNRELLLVSQFTLHGFLKGNKPDCSALAMRLQLWKVFLGR